MMPELAELTWDSLRNPFYLALLALLIMQLFKKGIELLLCKLLPEHAEDLKGIFINVITFAVCIVISLLHVGEEFSQGQAFVVAVVAAAVSTGAYETGKNVLKLIPGGALPVKGAKPE